MADEDLDIGTEIDAGEGDAGGKDRRGGFLGGALVKILKFVALGIGAIIFIVVVVIVTVRILSPAGSGSQTVVPMSEDYKGVPPKYTYYANIEEIRSRTSDEAPATVIVKVVIGYGGENKMLQTELIDRTPQIQDLLRNYFSSKKSAELRPEDETFIKEEIKERINRILADGKIDEVLFSDFNVVNF
ncbi:MAG: flagellar basal body protein FliL [Spirochaetales bacterium]|nr:MAG: flagellar basal body protein FliL [Spirochaetales bacterium]